jgi:hypothetical protein
MDSGRDCRGRRGGGPPSPARLGCCCLGSSCQGRPPPHPVHARPAPAAADGQERRLTPQPSSDADGWDMKPRRRRCSWNGPRSRSAATRAPPRSACGRHR